MNQQQLNHCLRTDSSLKLSELKCILLIPNLVLDSAVVKAQNVELTWRLPYYNNVSSQRNSLIQLTYYGESKEMTPNSQIVQTKENIKLSHGGPSQS